MPTSEMRSSARVAPRSVIVAAATSAMTCSTVGGVRLDRAGAGRVADGAEAHRLLDELFAVHHGDERADREQHAVALEDLAAVRVVDRRQLDAVLDDVLPDVELGPVRQREHADVLTLAVPAVVEVPQLGPLVLRVPLPEVVAERVHPLLGPGLLLVAPTTAEHGVEAVLGDRVEQRDGLEPVAARPGPRLLDRPDRRRSTSCTEATTSWTPSSATRRSR